MALALLVVVNLILGVANLVKFDLPPFGGEEAGDEGVETVDLTAESLVDEPAGPTEAEPDADVDDWPGGRGEVPAGPPAERRVVIDPSGRVAVTGSAPDWATAEALAQAVTAAMADPQVVIDNELTWHPDANDEVAAATVVIEELATFDLGQAEIDPSSVPALDYAAQLLVDRPMVFALVIGHTDNLGSDELNRELELERANVVVDYLVDAGVDRAQLIVAAAEDRPVEVEPDPGPDGNRRIELQLTNFLPTP